MATPLCEPHVVKVQLKHCATNVRQVCRSRPELLYRTITIFRVIVLPLAVTL
jgi:hypothetical protein